MEIIEFGVALLIFFVLLGTANVLKGHYWGIFAIALMLTVSGGVLTSGGITYGYPTQIIPVDGTLVFVLAMLILIALLTTMKIREQNR